MTLAPNWSRTWCVREGQSGMEGGTEKSEEGKTVKREEMKGRRRGREEKEVREEMMGGRKEER